MWDRTWRALLGVVLCLGAGESYRQLVTLPQETLAPAPPVEEPFADVSFGQEWYDGAQYGYRRGFVQGMSETAFGGELPATRAMAMTMLWRMAGRPEILGPSGFSDVEPDSWYTPAAVWAETRGVLLGYGDGTVRPQEKVTREQLQKMLERCLGRGQVEVFRAVVQPKGGGEGMTRGELTQILMELWEGEG
ncbi:MAG: S-layer homology domain-containing protein [Oscillospiraceae bacterium]|nr:S-layer homology domain-containing protein [Oscillospiraceae bacterium]